jgi:hypothetical protein
MAPKGNQVKARAPGEGRMQRKQPPGAALLAAHRLAHELEYWRARDAAKRDRRPRSKWERHFDPHAATELGNLILARLYPCNAGLHGQNDK